MGRIGAHKSPSPQKKNFADTYKYDGLRNVKGKTVIPLKALKNRIIDTLLRNMQRLCYFYFK
jgi:hypothetical protein